MKESDGGMTVTGYFLVQVAATTVGYGLAKGVGFLGKKAIARFKKFKDSRKVQPAGEVKAGIAPSKDAKGKKSKGR